MARSLNIVIGADIEKLQKGFNDAVSVVQSSGKRMSEAAAETAKSIQERLASIATKNPTAGTVRQLTNLAMEARALGPEFAATANDIIAAAGRMKDSIADARAEVSYFASDTRRIDAVLGGVEAVAGAFGAVEGALALSGVESEDLQKTMVKLQGAIALVNGVQAIQNALQAESAVRMGITTAATRLYTAATGGATGATLAFRTALMSIGIGVVVAGIGALVANFDRLKDAIFPADKALKDLNNTLDKSIAKQQNEVKILEAKGDKLGAFAKNEQILNETLKKARANFGENNKENWGKIIDDTKTALTVLKIERQNYIADEKAKEAEKAADLLQKQQEQNEKQKAKLKKFNEEKLKIELDAQNKMRIAQAKFVEGFKPAQVLGEPQAPSIKAFAKATGPLEQYTPVLKQTTEQQVVIITDYEKRMSDAANSINNAFNNLTAKGLEDFGNLLGDLMTGQINSFDDFGKALLGSVAQFMRAFGSALIATATASKAFKELLIKDPVLAAAAGVALVAGSAVISGMLKKGPQPTAFADGGIVSGPTLGLVGEYPGASSNPEVIAPLDKLRGMLKTNEGSGFVASTTIQGRDLAIVLERYNKDSKRG